MSSWQISGWTVLLTKSVTPDRYTAGIRTWVRCTGLVESLFGVGGEGAICWLGDTCCTWPPLGGGLWWSSLKTSMTCPKTLKLSQRSSDSTSAKICKSQVGCHLDIISALRTKSWDWLESCSIRTCSLTLSRGLVRKTPLELTPNIIWWCQASGIVCPGANKPFCKFKVATGTTPLLSQWANQCRRDTCRSGKKLKNRP